MPQFKTLPPDLDLSGELRLIAWRDDRYDPYGHDPRSSYVEQFWLSVLGPSTTWFLRVCAGKLDGRADAAVILADVARTIGIGYNGGSRSAMARTIARACKFGTARPASADTLAVRRRLPLLTSRQLNRLPRSQRRLHEAYVTSDAAIDCVSEQRRRARRLALGLVQCGDAPDSAEMQLERWQFEPAVAADAVRWAWSQHHGDVSSPTMADA